MEPLEYLRILRRRWILILITGLAGLAIGFVTAPGTANQVKHYSATHTLIINPQIDPKTFNVDQASLQAVSGAVPQNVAQKLGDNEDPTRLAASVKSVSNAKVGTIAITANSTDPKRAVLLADSFAQALVDVLSTNRKANYDQQVVEETAQVNSLQAQLDGMDPALASPTAPASPAKTQYDSINAQYKTQYGLLQSLITQGVPPAPLVTLDPAHASEVHDSALAPPKSKPARGILFGIIGLLIGMGLALAAEKLETRITSKRSAEEAFGLPVIAEIPPLPGGRKHRNELLTASRPASPFVEAYRGLRTVVLLSAHEMAQESGNGQVNGNRQGKVILITSPGAGEGKTTTVAHLAALLAEAGHSVLVVSADFRRPRVHELFGAQREPGLSEVLVARNGLTLGELNLSTNVEGVKLLASGAPVENPAPMLGAAAELIRAARKLFDFVLVDTAPLLVANDASELVSSTDLVLLISRARRTSLDAADRASEVLERIDAPTLGIILVAASDTPTAYNYYRYRYYGEAGEQPWWRRAFGRKGPKDDDVPAPARDNGAARPPSAPPEEPAVVGEMWRTRED